MDENVIIRENSTESANIHLLLMIREVLLKWWVIVMVAIIAGSCAYVGASIMYTPQYQTQTTFVVSVRDGSTSVYANLNAAKNMANAFSEMLNSDVMKKRIASELETDSVNGSISTSVIEETNLLEMRVTASNPKDAYLITKATLNNYEDLAATVLNNTVLEILQQPVIPTVPINTNGALRIAELAAVAAALAVIVLICVQSYLRDTVKSISEVDSKLDTKLLATVYHEKKIGASKRKKKSILITDPVTGFAFVETFKKLRSRLEYYMRKNDKKVLMVTSVMENEGKSTVAVNIALAMNRRKKRVLLIDADLKKPSIHKILDYQGVEYASITDFLAGEASLRQTLLTDKERGLGLLLSKHGVKNSTERVKSKYMQELIMQARKNVDVVIIDTPPMSVSPDAECIAELADAAILVVRQNLAPTRVINDAIDIINNTDAQLLGCVFNNVFLADLNEYYSYGGGGKYGYVKRNYGRHGYGKYGYGKYGYGNRSTSNADGDVEKLKFENEQDGKGFLEGYEK